MHETWAWMLAILASTGTVATATATVIRDEAVVRSVSGGRLLYRESHYVADGATSERWVLYRCPDGTPFARKHVLASLSPAAPDFMLEDGRDGYREGVRGDGKTRVVYAGEGRDGESARALAVPADGVIDAGFDAAVRAHWDTLVGGKAIELRFLVPSRKQFFPVRVQRIVGNDPPDAGTMQLRMRLATWFGFAIPDVTLVYGLVDRRLLVFNGTGNVRDSRGRYPRVRIEFDPRAGTASSDEFARIRNIPLDGHCPF